MTDLASFSLHVIYICSFYFSFFLFEALGNAWEGLNKILLRQRLLEAERLIAIFRLMTECWQTPPSRFLSYFFFQSCSRRNGEVNLVLKYGCDMLGEWGSLVYR